MGDYQNSIEYFGRSVEIQEKLQDNKYLASTLNNLGETFFYQENYLMALENFRKSIGAGGNDQDNLYNNERYIGISHHYLGNYDSSNVYLKRADEYYSMSEVKRMPILPYLVIANQKIGEVKASKDALNDFMQIADENDPEKKTLSWLLGFLRSSNSIGRNERS